MSIGTRIMEIRKKNNLSQEAFGDTLGVSRQAISKWEMDASIPDVEKLILMSQLYDVTVGYILGMEESAEDVANASTVSGDLTPEQLKMVEEIVDRYIRALPKESSGEGRSWGNVLAVASLVCSAVLLVALIWNSYSLNKYITRVEAEQKVLSLEQQFLERNITNVESNVSSRLEEQLKNVLQDVYEVILDHGWEVVDHDIQANTLTLSVYAMTKQYGEDTHGVFVVSDGFKDTKAEAIRDGNRLSATLVVPRSNFMQISLLLTTNGVTDVTYLGKLDDQFAVKFPGNYVIGGLPLEYLPYENGVLGKKDYHLHMKTDPQLTGPLGDSPIVKAELIYYVNEERALVYELPVEIKDGQAWWEMDFDMEIPLKEGDTIADVICLIDEMGRQTRTIRSACKVKDGQMAMWGITDVDYFAN